MQLTLRCKCVLLAAAAVCGFAQSSSPIAGRWEGKVEIPGRPFTLVIDLAPDGSGHWTGSAIAPGLGVKGAALANLNVKDDAVEFAVPNVLGEPTLKAQITAAGMSGEFVEAGNRAPFTLHRTGAAQVDLPKKSTLVQHELEGPWEAGIVYGDRDFQVKLTLTNGEGAASATLMLVRTKENPLPIGMVRQEDAALALASADGQIALDAMFDKNSGEIRGTLQLGPTEIPIAFHKGNAK